MMRSLVSRPDRLTGIRLALIVAGLWCAKPDPLPASAAEDTLVQRFLKEAPAGWKEYESFAGRLQGTVHFRYTSDGKLRSDSKFQMKQNRNCKLAICQYLMDSETSGSVNVFNPRYAFSLERATEDRPWMVALLVEKTSAQRSKPEADASNNNARAFDLVNIPYSFHLSDLVAQKSFRVREATSVDRGGRQLVRVVFEFPHPLPRGDTAFCLAQAGTLLLDPANCWYLVSGELDGLWSGDVKGKVTVENTVSDFDGTRPMPKKSVRTETVYRPGAQAPNVNLLTWDFDYTVPKELPPDSEFTLSAFGFPEPGFARPRNPWHLWIAAAGVACVAAGLYVRRRLVQRAAT